MNEFLLRGLPFNEGDVDGSTVDFDNDGRFEVAMSRDTKYEGSFAAVDQKSWFGLFHQLSDGKNLKVWNRRGINDDAQMPMWKRMKGAQNHAWSDIDRGGARISSSVDVIKAAVVRTSYSATRLVAKRNGLRFGCAVMRR